MSSLTFVGGLMSCPGGEGATDVLHEGACYWAKAGGGSSRMESSATEPGYQQHAMRLQAGGQFALSQPGWFGGLSLGLEDSHFDSVAPAHSGPAASRPAVSSNARWVPCCWPPPPATSTAAPTCRGR
uniref:Autotransporter domain-containing protein n=1 Tax=Phenylobacterium glaciei TaxID=2803784 RepID=A0A974S843_9CAUL|nr:hypothetical protein JKL49_25205 [Phenylobacterium glaciei]